jgi:hypothetical protein
LPIRIGAAGKDMEQGAFHVIGVDGKKRAKWPLRSNLNHFLFASEKTPAFTGRVSYTN